MYPNPPTHNFPGQPRRPMRPLRRKRYGSGLSDSILPILMIVFILGIMVFEVGGFAGRLASEKKAEHALVVQGFSNIHLKARHVFFIEFRGCSKTDAARFDFTATNAAGKTVEVHVCEGWPLKGATIRN